jgi:hypothetical protein
MIIEANRNRPERIKMSEDIERALDNLKGTTMAVIRNLRSFGMTKKQIEEVLNQINREMEEEYRTAV